ncbi:MULTISPECIES: transposase family protein [unclassified Bradyrhizobium]|uniref:transposase family protein n=1 Tax=unclassified Bradyrhizobium TaxID=2631580 RepID=UPI0033908CD2
MRPTSGTSLCPGCGTSSGRIHSRYQRRLTDLPLAGRQVRLVVVARRFRCVTALCGRRIFTERFDDGALAPWARRTTRLDLIVHHLGLALGGRPAANFARRLMLPVSNDTLLRVVRRRACPASSRIATLTGIHAVSIGRGLETPKIENVAFTARDQSTSLVIMQPGVSTPDAIATFAVRKTPTIDEAVRCPRCSIKDVASL